MIGECCPKVSPNVLLAHIIVESHLTMRTTSNTTVTISSATIYSTIDPAGVVVTNATAINNNANNNNDDAEVLSL